MSAAGARASAGPAPRCPLPAAGLPAFPPPPAWALPRLSPRPPLVWCFPARQDGVRVEARRAGAAADPAAAQGVPVPGHHHAESRATSILCRGPRRAARAGRAQRGCSGPGGRGGGRGQRERGLRSSRPARRRAAAAARA